MNNLFDNTDKLVKWNRNISKELQIKNVLNPFTRMFIDEQLAKDLGIIFNGYYRNCYGGLIPLHIAANKGFIQYSTNDKIEIEYRSKQYPIITNLIIHQVYDNKHQCMISCQQAIDNGYLNLELLLYLSMKIHEAFLHGFIIGELRTNTIKSKSINYINENENFEYDYLYSSLTNIINNLSEFRNTINIIDECELTSDGFIRHKITNKSYLLTQAIELGLVSIKDISLKTQMDNSINYSTMVNDTTLCNKDISCTNNETIPYFSDTFILDLLTTNSNSIDESQQDEMHSTNIKRFLSIMNTC
ncbi:unnamed protein product [Rotaria sordida]|uniref:Uncharacterized protein n=1 Tax=Rotaria sordida TaxID=392033 RepID=A0A815P2Y2_9BILA|nr:unnamed protein product [Rotaria sordida]CAF1427597.1 unnamed protein product [Rotaria sordida]CAF1443437.1 unnamed protein product [Rotaria sordida]CAF3889354.1 unnamed protein product [Rotaria sordida]CAF3910474.1 unnamed protein product [Rotaria sordida]